MSDLNAYLDHLQGLHPKKIDLVLDRVTRLLDNLGNPERRLPPVIHVAGTNGKGSMIAMLRAILEAAGLRVHVYISPHLIDFNERVRLAGRLATDAQLITALRDCERANDGAPITFFEITTVAAFLLFAVMPADVLLLEVGLGGRLDATNVVTPVVSAITRISRDHTEFLGETLPKIAREKAGIMKPEVPCVIGYQKDDMVYETLSAHAEKIGTPLYFHKNGWMVRETAQGMLYRFQRETIALPKPNLVGAHQILNAGVAITCAKLFKPELDDAAIAHGIRHADWPGRLQHINSGAVFELLPAGWELWVDGAHNDSGAEILAAQCAAWQTQDNKPLHLIMGMQVHKDYKAFLNVLRPYAETITVIPVPGHESVTAQHISQLTVKAILTAADAATALQHLLKAQEPIQQTGRVIVAGSLYLTALVA